MPYEKSWRKNLKAKVSILKIKYSIFLKKMNNDYNSTCTHVYNEVKQSRFEKF